MIRIFEYEDNSASFRSRWGFSLFCLEMVGDIQTFSLQHEYCLLKLHLLSISLEFFPFFCLEIVSSFTTTGVVEAKVPFF